MIGSEYFSRVYGYWGVWALGCCLLSAGFQHTSLVAWWAGGLAVQGASTRMVSGLWFLMPPGPSELALLDVVGLKEKEGLKTL